MSVAAQPAAVDRSEIERTSRVLVQQGLVTPERVQMALRLLARVDPPKPLAALVVELGWVSAQALDQALALDATALGGSRQPAQGRAPSSPRVRPGSIAARVQAAIHEGKVDLPVLPEAARKIRTIVERDGGAREIVEIIEREPSLAAAVLRYSNSVAYAGLKETTDLQQAVMRLGFINVEKTVMAISAKGAFGSADKADEHLYRSLWQHSLATALAARRLTPRSIASGAETVFLAGLLHDIGKVVVLKCASQLRKSDPERFGFDDAALMEFISLLHCGAGEQLCAAWKLPDEIRAVVLRHHDDDLRGPDDTLIAVVQLANLMTRKVGASLSPDADESLVTTPAAIMLELDEVALAGQLVELEKDLANIDDLF